MPYDSADNKRIASNEDGTLAHLLKVRVDYGSEFKRPGASFEDAVREVTISLRVGKIRARNAILSNMIRVESVLD